MIRKAFKMKVYKQYHEEYKKRHDELWSEILKMLRDKGLISYSIFLEEETSVLFGYVEYKDEMQWNSIPDEEINRKWWDYMADIMDTNDDNSPITKDLLEVFHIEIGRAHV